MVVEMEVGVTQPSYLFASSPDPQYHGALTRILLHLCTVKMSGGSQANALHSYSGRFG